jgi:transposase
MSNEKSKRKSNTLARDPLTVGVDIGDRYSHYCVLDGTGQILEEDRVRTTPDGLRKWLTGRPRMRIAFEAGTHSRWVSEILKSAGHEVLVANTRQVRLIWAGRDKTDRIDARKLARLARFEPELLAPIEHRSAERQSSLVIVRARDALVRSRSLLINTARALLKTFGVRVERCCAQVLPKRVDEKMPPELRRALAPLLEQIDAMNEAIRCYDETLEHEALTKYPETKLLTQVQGVGSLTALSFVLTIGDRSRFQNSRSIGSFVGLCPRRSDSVSLTPQLGISKAGNPYLRRLLVGCAQYILGRFGCDSDLRRWVLKLAERGGRNGKKRAVAAVARKLAVLLHKLWVTGEVYEPLRNAQRLQAAA